MTAAEGNLEVVVTADAAFDETKSQLVMELTSQIRRVGFGVSEAPVLRNWLPATQTLRERMSFEDALPAAKEIFHKWASRTRHSVPTTEVQSA